MDENLAQNGGEVIHVTQYLRHPNPAAFSIERVYRDVRAHLPSDIETSTSFSRFPSHGFVRRLLDTVRARRFQGDVNHITGDVHFITYLLDRRRTILTIHDCDMLERSSGLRHWLLWFFWLWLAEKRCSVIVAISTETKEKILCYVHCDPNKIIVVHNPVFDDFLPHRKPFNEKHPRVLQIGTGHNKNIDRIVPALSGLNVTLVIVGKITAQQESLLRQHEVNYENQVGLSDGALVEQYRECDLLVFASTSEGFGLPIVEAQAVGRPVVTSCVSSMPEVAGQAACMVDPFDIASIRAGVIKVIEDASYREELIRLGRENVRRFRSSKVAETYASLYRAVHNGELA